jgi:hypothetical protein
MEGKRQTKPTASSKRTCAPGSLFGRVVSCKFSQPVPIHVQTAMVGGGRAYTTATKVCYPALSLTRVAITYAALSHLCLVSRLSHPSLCSLVHSYTHSITGILADAEERLRDADVGRSRALGMMFRRTLENRARGEWSGEEQETMPAGKDSCLPTCTSNPFPRLPLLSRQHNPESRGQEVGSDGGLRVLQTLLLTSRRTRRPFLKRKWSFP